MKAAWDFRRSIVSARLLAELAAEYGVPLDTVLRNTGITADQLRAPTAEVEARQELQLIRNVVQALPAVPTLGLIAGTRYHLTTYGIWGFALTSSPNFRSAVNVALRYLHLTYTFNRMLLEQDAEETRLVLDDHEIPDDVRRFCVERDAAATLTIQRELVGHAAPLRSLQLRFPRPSYADSITRLFGIEAQYDAARNVASFEPDVLDQPLLQANAITAELCEAQCRKLLSERRSRDGVAGKVRDRLLHRPGQMPDMETIAAELHVTTRTLRRKLLDEGSSFRALVDEVREALAEELLRTAGLSIEDIAARLGYAETSSFIHAFKRWKGQAPSVYRAHSAARPAAKTS
ncbi:AraC family transcriptional regulator [Sinimarinibacterium sp. CAU 1509]|uniref:AraC family transcriptional regulator n=1 Tax=Sinimarinibacterium sp. CAU 1509 TaxID=2562283 RepID=UPI0010AD4793|nr:AraC family transcriptional regulator [Sinimarinibacterium sp. CAU 1509]TJY64953.1 AraC family transcriptional regulator [Sinimarinibacterium sp. CAU 1509]